LKTTFALLTNTDNEAAVRVLIPALDSKNSTIQEGALISLLKRRTTAGGREILDRISQMKPEWRTIIRQHRGRLTATLREAVLSGDPIAFENACRAALIFYDYDLIPILLSVLDSNSQPQVELAAKTILELSQLLYEELSGAREPGDRRDPQVVRRYVLGSLESSVHRYHQHKRSEVIESFLLLVAHENATLRQIIGNFQSPTCTVVMELLAKSAQRGVIRLLLNFLEDTHAPIPALAVIGTRTDARFVHYLMRKIGREPSHGVALNLKKLTSIAWLSDCRRVIEPIDDEGQHAAVRFAMLSSAPRFEVFSLIEYLLTSGKPAGRREAARALTDFQGAAANELAMKALNDPDPQVQANIIPQLRGRGIPGALSSLLQMVESPHAVVAKAARENLSEFSFKRYVAAFDLLDEEVRRSTGVLVKKVDPRTLPDLQAELQSPIRSRRLRGLAIARSIDAVAALEDFVLDLLTDTDHLVRLEAVTTLAHCPTQASAMALREALSDNSETVRQAAQQSLEMIDEACRV
jgi:HEAT repeat protein